MVAEQADSGQRRARAPHLQWIELGLLKPSPKAQRQFSPAWAAKLAADFNLEGMGYPCVNKRAGEYHVVDGWHRVHVLLNYVGFAPMDTVQCELYEDLTDEGEAELFLERNNSRTVAPLDKFLKAVVAGRPIESHIAQVIEAQGLRIGRRERGNGALSAVASVRSVHDRLGLLGLAKTLKIIQDAYGNEAFEAQVIEGIGLCLHRYGLSIDAALMSDRLAKTPGGLNGLLQPAEQMRLKLGQPRAHCVAASAVAIYNRGVASSAKRLPSWWKE